jgi:hypothetical protein
MKNLINILFILIAGSSIAQDKVDHTQTFTNGKFVSALNNGEGNFTGYELGLNHGFSLSAKVYIVNKPDMKNKGIMIGANYILSPLSKVDESFFNTEFYVGLNPLSFQHYKSAVDGVTDISNHYTPSGIIGYKLLFWETLVLDMYAGYQFGKNLQGVNGTPFYTNEVAGIGLGIRF